MMLHKNHILIIKHKGPSLKFPLSKKTVNYNRYFNKRVNTVKGTRVNTARPKAEVNTVKASASWVWKPKHEDLDHVSKSNSASKTLARYDYVDALGSDDDSFVLIVLMFLWYPIFLNLVRVLENLKTNSSDNEESLGEDASKHGRIDDNKISNSKVEDDMKLLLKVMSVLGYILWLSMEA
ncbi:hypothetical protein Tco_0039109 [Tanacetum coccineum]